MRKLLYPFSFLYYIIIQLRNLLYSVGFFRQIKIGIPVISVGNLSTGGTGKTPVTIALISALKKDYNHIVVISRGYNRHSKGAHIVSLKGEIKLSVSEAGDEPYMIAKRFKDVSVVVAERRLEGYNLVKELQPGLVILDDGFQHRSVYRDLDIVLLNGYQPYSKDFLLPAGNLREPISSLKRANCIVNTKKKIDAHFSQIPTFDLTSMTDSYSKEVDISSEFIAFSGIANNQDFFNSLIDDGIKLKTTKSFPDHYNYGKKDFQNLENEIIITTEKDYYKIENFYENVIYRRIDLKMDPNLIRYINNYLRNYSNRGIIQ